MDKKFNPKIADIARKKTGEHFRNRREELGLSQSELGSCAGLKQQHHLSRFENGLQNIGINNLFALAGCLRMEIQFITKDPNSVPGFPENSDN
jgi:transcriptional regulator with XRE-family HTH domain